MLTTMGPFGYFVRFDHRFRDCSCARWTVGDTFGLCFRWPSMLLGHGSSWRDGRVPAYQIRLRGICHTFRGSCLWLCCWLELSSAYLTCDFFTQGANYADDEHLYVVAQVCSDCRIPCSLRTMCVRRQFLPLCSLLRY